MSFIIKVYGVYGRDELMLNQVTVSNQTIGLATNFSTSATLGVGIWQDPNSYQYTSFLQNLQTQGQINSLIYSVYLNDIAGNGDIYFGAVDETKFWGELHNFENPASYGGLVPIDGVFWVDKNGTNTSLAASGGSTNGSIQFGNIQLGTT